MKPVRAAARPSHPASRSVPARRSRRRDGEASAPRTKTVVVVGAGNIGSFLLALLARLPLIARLVIIDRDHYEAKNVWGQDITARDVGQAKAIVQARRVRRINPAVSVSALVEPAEDVPLGWLRADLILACLDSRAARRYVNQAAWRLGVPWINAGVHPDGLLACVEAFVPGPDSPCLECGWSRAEYEALEQVYPCDDGKPGPPPSNSPPHLGALAAALQVIEGEKLLRGETQDALIGRQVVLDARAHRHFVTAQRRNPRCLFDHITFGIERLGASPEQLSMGQVLALAPVVRKPHGELSLRVDGKTFLTQVRCPDCGSIRSILFRLSGRLRPADAICSECGGTRLPAGFDTVERLSALLPKSQLARPLSSFGFRPGDVFTLATAEAEAHFELGPE